MLNTLSNLRISVKLMIGVALSTILTIVIAALGVLSLQSGAEKTRFIAERDTVAVGLSGEIRALQNRVEQMWLFAVIENDRPDFENLMRNIAQSNSEIDESLTKLDSLAPSQHSRLTALRAALTDYRAQTAKIPAFWEQKRQEDAEDVLQHDAKDAFESIMTLSRELSKAVHDQAAANAVSVDKDSTSTIWTMILASGIGLVAIVGIVLALIRFQVVLPIAGLTQRMRRLADGDTSIEVDNATQRDEIGEMARAVIVFRDNARQQKADAEAKAKADAEQREVVDQLSKSLACLSTGDLTVDITAEFPPAYVEVRTNFNQAIAALRELIGTVLSSTATINTGSREIAVASEDLARRTEGNAASLEQTSAAVTQMNDRLRATAAAAQRTVDRADGAISTVAEGRNVADEATQAMSRVSDSAKGIDSVIEGLDKIAFQTRVLAMNAAVEAGRAGEAGRGFAVVADLVSALAMRAEEESKRAREQLTVTQEEIVSAVDMVQKVDGALATILTNVGEVHKLVGDIATDNQAQSSAVTEISTAIGAMDQSTQQNAAMVEETSAAARSLSSEVSTLADKAATFRIGDASQSVKSYSAPAPAAKPKAAAPVKAPSSTQAAVRKSEPKPAYQSPVKALPANSTVGADDDWSSF